MFELLICAKSSECSGCEWLDLSYAEQKDRKVSQFRKEWQATGQSLADLPSIEWVGVDRGGLRDRVDLMIDSRSGQWCLGLLNKERTGLVDLDSCPQLSPDLDAWLREFRNFRIPVQRGSVRLRVSPSGQRGAWLDFANVDIKALLDEGTLLRELSRTAIVEIGQKRKRLIERDGQLKLSDPELHPWFRTFLKNPDGSLQKQNLYCAIGSFTQPGFRANEALVGTVIDFVAASPARTAVEFGSGIGNFTLPLASLCNEVRAYEVDGLALEGLRRSLSESGLKEKVRIHEGNYHSSKKISAEFSGADLVLVDPPRSGLIGFLDPIEGIAPIARPRHFAYVSCFGESFARDGQRLANVGYRLRRLSLVDQFPQSRHIEIVALFEIVR